MMARWIVAILTGALALGGAAAAQDRLDYYAFPKNKGCYYGYKDAVYGYYCDGKPASKPAHGPRKPGVSADPNHVVVEPAPGLTAGAFTDLAAAIAFAAEGGRVVIKPGVYHLAGPIYLNKSIRLEGLENYGAAELRFSGSQCLIYSGPSRTNAPALFVTGLRFTPAKGYPPETDAAAAAPASEPCVDIRQGFVRLGEVQFDMRSGDGGAVRMLDGDLEIEGAQIFGPHEFDDRRDASAQGVREAIETPTCRRGGYGVCVEGGEARVDNVEIAGFAVGARASGSISLENSLIYENGVGLDLVQSLDRFADMSDARIVDTVLRRNDVGVLARNAFEGDFRASNYEISRNRVAGLYVGEHRNGKCDISNEATLALNGGRDGRLWAAGEFYAWIQAGDQSAYLDTGSADLVPAPSAAQVCALPF